MDDLKTYKSFLMRMVKYQNHICELQRTQTERNFEKLRKAGLSPLEALSRLYNSNRIIEGILNQKYENKNQ